LSIKRSGLLSIGAGRSMTIARTIGRYALLDGFYCATCGRNELWQEGVPSEAYPKNE